MFVKEADLLEQAVDKTVQVSFSPRQRKRTWRKFRWMIIVLLTALVCDIVVYRLLVSLVELMFH